MDIKSLRVKLEISQQQLADYLLVGRTMLALMETGKKNIPFLVAKKLLDLENPDAQKEVPLIKPESLYKKWFIEDAMKARLHAIDKLKRRLYIERRTQDLLKQEFNTELQFHTLKEEQRRQNPLQEGSNEHFYSTLQIQKAGNKIPKFSIETGEREVEVRVLEFAVAEWERWMRG